MAVELVSTFEHPTDAQHRQPDSMGILEDLPPPVATGPSDRCLWTRKLGFGRRLVLFHGGPGLDHHLLLPLGLELARSFEVWLPDLPGHGRSYDSSRGLPDLETVVERTARWLEATTMAPTVLCGHSLGSYVVREIVRRNRAAPSAVILMTPAAPTIPGADAAPSNRRVSHPGSNRRGERALRAEILELCEEDAEGAALSGLFREAVARARLRHPASYPALLAQLRRALAQPLAPSRPEHPTLVLCGEHDRISPLERASEVQRSIAGSSLEVLAGSGHFPFAVDARRVAEPILRFLAAGLPAPS